MTISQSQIQLLRDHVERLDSTMGWFSTSRFNPESIINSAAEGLGIKLPVSTKNDHQDQNIENLVKIFILQTILWDAISDENFSSSNLKTSM